jgi:hypothetical protein
MKTSAWIRNFIKATAAGVALAALTGCQCGGLFGGKQAQHPAHDRPFPLGHVTDAHWETQQTNAEAGDFIFFDHEFKGDTAELAPGAKKKLMQVALRLEHVPFPVVIEQSPHNADPELDAARRQTVIEQLARIGVTTAEERVVISEAFSEGYTGVEGERAYWGVINGSFGSGGGWGRRFGGAGGFFR